MDGGLLWALSGAPWGPLRALLGVLLGRLDDDDDDYDDEHVASGGLLGASWKPLGGLLVASWERHGASWRPLAGSLGASWGSLGRF